MEITFAFVLKSVLLGVGLAMDAFSVSLANGLNEPKMKTGRMGMIAGVFAFFQAAMPMAGWVCVHTIVQCFQKLQKFIPWIALLLLCFIGGQMLLEGRNMQQEEDKKEKLTLTILLMQGIATSIDALSVGFTIAEYGLLMAIVCVVLIASVTFVICVVGLLMGKKFGTGFAGKTNILGGVILIGIGLEIFITGILG